MQPQTVMDVRITNPESDESAEWSSVDVQSVQAITDLVRYHGAYLDEAGLCRYVSAQVDFSTSYPTLVIWVTPE